MTENKYVVASGTDQDILNRNIVAYEELGYEVTPGNFTTTLVGVELVYGVLMVKK